MKKVLIPTKLDTVAADLLRSHGGYEVVQDDKTPFAELIAAHSDTYALIVRSEPVGEETFAALPALKVVIRAGAGVNTIDTKAARRHGIDVMNTPGANSKGVAEEVVALILADCRHIVPADASTRAGLWEKKKFMGRELAGKTVGIVGLGHIGRLVAKRIEGFECKVLGYDPLVPAEKARAFGVEPVTLEKLFAESDFVTLHIPENNETRGMFSAKYFSLMKKGATLVNCARAGIVNEDDLRAAKAERGIRYLNDVYPKDEPGEKSVADVADLMMPHLGASTLEANLTAARRSAEQLIDLDDRGVTSFIVNRDIPDGLDPAFCTLAYTLAGLGRALIGRQVPLSRIETSFYGSLAPFQKWLFLSLLHGIWDDIDRTTDYKRAIAQLEEQGVSYENRAIDSSKHYENSMTVDLLGVSEGRQVKVSVRGTVAEGVCMVSRINEFDRLYWVPRSVNTLFAQYPDRPGVIGFIGNTLAEAGINIEDMRNPHDEKTGNSLVILNTDKPVPADLLGPMCAEIKATFVVSTTL